MRCNDVIRVCFRRRCFGLYLLVSFSGISFIQSSVQTRCWTPKLAHSYSFQPSAEQLSSDCAETRSSLQNKTGEESRHGKARWPGTSLNTVLVPGESSAWSRFIPEWQIQAVVMHFPTATVFFFFFLLQADSDSAFLSLCSILSEFFCQLK